MSAKIQPVNHKSKLMPAANSVSLQAYTKQPKKAVTQCLAADDKTDDYLPDL